MADRRMVCGGGDPLNQTQKHKISSHDQPLDSVFTSPLSKTFLGPRAMLSFGAVGRGNGSGNSFFRSFDQEESGDEYLDEYFNLPEKKRRLSGEQVQFLEKNFEAENKLEPERKIQLAKELGLQPRQIAVWFQNRRARWKTRQLETDYETLHASYQRLKTDYDNLHEENEKLKAQVLYLKQNGPAGVAENADLQLCETNELSQAIPEEGIAAVVDSGNGESRGPAMGLNSVTEVETSPDGLQSFVLEAGDSSRFLEFEESELSQNGEDDLHVELWQTDYIFPEIGDAYCHPVVDHVFDLWRH